MSRDDIIRMTKEAGFDSWDGSTEGFRTMIERFASLVAAAERNKLTAAAECFRVCEHKEVCNEKTKGHEANRAEVLGKS